MDRDDFETDEEYQEYVDECYAMDVYPDCYCCTCCGCTCEYDDDEEEY